MNFSRHGQNRPAAGEPQPKANLLKAAENDKALWSYRGKGTPGTLRLISVQCLLYSKNPRISLSEWHIPSVTHVGIRIENRDLPNTPRYCAISHVWNASPGALERSERANRPLLVDLGESNVHKTSWLGLVQAATAAKWLECEYVWLDLLCLDQTSHEDKKL